MMSKVIINRREVGNHNRNGLGEKWLVIMKKDFMDIVILQLILKKLIFLEGKEISKCNFNIN